MAVVYFRHQIYSNINRICSEMISHLLCFYRKVWSVYTNSHLRLYRINRDILKTVAFIVFVEVSCVEVLLDYQLRYTYLINFKVYSGIFKHEIKSGKYGRISRLSCSI